TQTATTDAAPVVVPSSGAAPAAPAAAPRTGPSPSPRSVPAVPVGAALDLPALGLPDFTALPDRSTRAPRPADEAGAAAAPLDRTASGHGPGARAAATALAVSGLLLSGGLL